MLCIVLVNIICGQMKICMTKQPSYIVRLLTAFPGDNPSTGYDTVGATKKLYDLEPRHAFSHIDSRSDTLVTQQPGPNPRTNSLICRIANRFTSSAAIMSTIDAGSDRTEKEHKARPEKPDEQLYKESLAKAEKEHTVAQEKLVRSSSILLGSSSTKLHSICWSNEALCRMLSRRR